MLLSNDGLRSNFIVTKDVKYFFNNKNLNKYFESTKYQLNFLPKTFLV